MKKAFAVISILAFLLLTACGEKAPQAQSTVAPPSENSAAATGEDQSVPTKNTSYLSPYMQSVTADGYYYIENRVDTGANIKYLDFNSQQSIVLCSSPECAHNSESCRGWIGNVYNTSQIISAANQLLLVYPGNAQNYEMDPKTMFAHIDTIKLDGSDRKTIASYESNFMFTNFFAIDGDTLYYQLDAYGLEDKNSKTTCLESLNLATGQRNTIKAGLSDRTFFMGASGNALFLKEIIPPESVTDARSAYQNQKHRISKLSLTTGEESEILSWLQDDLQEIFVENTLLCVTKEYAVNRFNLTDATQEALFSSNQALQETAQALGQNTKIQPLFLSEANLVCKMTSVGENPMDTKDALIALNLQAQTIQTIQSPTVNEPQDKPLSICAVTKDKLVLITDYTEVQTSFVAEDGTVYPVSLPQPNFVVIPAQEFFAEKQ